MQALCQRQLAISHSDCDGTIRLTARRRRIMPDTTQAAESPLAGSAAFWGGDGECGIRCPEQRILSPYSSLWGGERHVHDHAISR